MIPSSWAIKKQTVGGIWCEPQFADPRDTGSHFLLYFYFTIYIFVYLFTYRAQVICCVPCSVVHNAKTMSGMTFSCHSFICQPLLDRWGREEASVEPPMRVISVTSWQLLFNSQGADNAAEFIYLMFTVWEMISVLSMLSALWWYSSSIVISNSGVHKRTPGLSCKLLALQTWWKTLLAVFVLMEIA